MVLPELTISGPWISRDTASVRLSAYKLAMFIVLHKADGAWVARDDLLATIRPEAATKKYTQWNYKSWNVTMHNLRNQLRKLDLRIERQWGERCRLPTSSAFEDKRGRASFRLADARTQEVLEEKAA